jgi:hypothetical protein
VKYILFLFLGYLLYQLVFKFIIPVYKTTARLKKGFKEMHERNQQSEEQQTEQQQTQSSYGPSQDDDYIDFEELK